MDSHRQQQLFDALSSRILILDGAMGTMLQEHQPTLEDFGGAHLENCNENLCRTRPEWVADVHRAYLAAGSDIIETNSFQGSPIVLAEFDLVDKTHEINVLAAQLARKAATEYSTAAKPRFVAGSLGPTTKSLSLRGDVTFADLRDSYYAQAKGLVEGGADILLIETGFDTRNVKSGPGCHSAPGEGTWPQASGDGLGHDRALGARCSPASPSTRFTLSLAHADLMSIGLNCATGPDLMTDHIRTLAEMASTRNFLLPERGPAELEEDKYLETPDSLAHQVSKNSSTAAGSTSWADAAAPRLITFVLTSPR